MNEPPTIFNYLNQKVGYDMSEYIGKHLIEIIRKESEQIMINLKKSVREINENQTEVLRYIRPNLEYQVTQYILYTSPDISNHRQRLMNLYQSIKTDRDPNECNRMFIEFKEACTQFEESITKQYEDICILVSNNSMFFGYEVRE